MVSEVRGLNITLRKNQGLFAARANEPVWKIVASLAVGGQSQLVLESIKGSFHC